MNIKVIGNAAVNHIEESPELDAPVAAIACAYHLAGGRIRDRSRRAFWDLIYSLTAAGTTVFVSTHYMEEAEYCHRLALMNRGRLIALDTPAALRAGLAEPVFEIRTDDGLRAVEALAGEPGVRAAGLFGRAVHVTAAPGPGGERALAAHLAARGVRFSGVERIEPTLEHVFIARVQTAGGARED